MKQLIVDNENQTIKGEYKVDGLTLPMYGDDFKPYDLTFGAIASCFSATLFSYAAKKQIAVNQVIVNLDGQKRSEVPTTLETIDMDVTVVANCTNEVVDDLVNHAFNACSMVQTFCKVAKFNVTTHYQISESSQVAQGQSCNIKGGC